MSFEIHLYRYTPVLRPFQYCCSVSFSDPVAVRHSLEILYELCTKDPYAVAMALGNTITLRFETCSIILCFDMLLSVHSLVLLKQDLIILLTMFIFFIPGLQRGLS